MHGQALGAECNAGLCAGEHKFIGGEKPSIADSAWVGMLAMFNASNYGTLDDAHFAQYVEDFVSAGGRPRVAFFTHDQAVFVLEHTGLVVHASCITSWVEKRFYNAMRRFGLSKGWVIDVVGLHGHLVSCGMTFKQYFQMHSPDYNCSKFIKKLA